MNECSVHVYYIHCETTQFLPDAYTMLESWGKRHSNDSELNTKAPLKLTPTTLAPCEVPKISLSDDRYFITTATMAVIIKMIIRKFTECCRSNSAIHYS